MRERARESRRKTPRRSQKSIPKRPSVAKNAVGTAAPRRAKGSSEREPARRKAAKAPVGKATGRGAGGKRSARRTAVTAAAARAPAAAQSPGAAAAVAKPAARKSSRSMSRRQAQILLNLEQSLRKRIMGKGDAVERIARVVRVRMSELDFRPERPNGSFLLVGPSGVGKNELAYALSQALYGGDDRVVSVDLEELHEEGDIAKLVATLVPGSADTYQEGLLTSPVRRDPQSIVLLRGLERVHSSFHPILQQILERGVLEDMLGPVSFSQAILFVTARPRRDEPSGTEIGFSRPVFAPEEVLRRRLERTFSPDLLDSFNEIIELPDLTPEDVRRIARYKVEEVLRRLTRRHKEIAVDEKVFEEFIPEEEARRDGASFLHRTLEDRLFNPLARYLLSHRDSRSIHVEMVNGVLKIGE